MRGYFAARLLRYNLPVSLLATLLLVLADSQQMPTLPGQNALAGLAGFALIKLAFIIPTAGFGLSWLLYLRFNGFEFPLFFNLGIGRRQLAILAWLLALVVGLGAFGLAQGMALWPA